MSPTEIALLDWFKMAWPGPAARASPWLFGFGETMHFVGLCLLFGALLIVDLRLLGFFRWVPVKSALAFVPYSIVGFVILAATGWLFFTSNPAAYYGNSAFRIKMLVILLAGINAVIFAIYDHRHAAMIEANHVPGRGSQLLAGTSLGLWLSALILGRLLPLYVVGEN